MSLFLPVKLGGSNVSVAICDRCRKKVYYDELVQDGDSPGLRVCPSCSDEPDPYGKPARVADRISLQYPRPDNFPTVHAVGTYDSYEILYDDQRYNYDGEIA